MSLARFFQRPHYESELTQLVRHLKEANPHLETEQIEGRALLWDKTIDRAEQAELQRGRVPQKAYVYQTAPEPRESDE